MLLQGAANSIKAFQDKYYQRRLKSQDSIIGAINNPLNIDYITAPCTAIHAAIIAERSII